MFRLRETVAGKFLASRFSGVAIFVHLVVTLCESACCGQKTPLRDQICVSLAQGHKKMRLGSSKVAVCLHERLGRTVFLRTATQNASPKSKFAFRLRETLLRISAGLFSLRRATQNASPEVKICLRRATKFG